MDDFVLAPMIEHTQLSATASRAQIENLCRQAMAHHFWGVCVNPIWVQFCAKLLAPSAQKTVTVVGFPLGACGTPTKVYATALAVAQSVDEIDMVISLGALKDRDYHAVEQDIRAVVQAAEGKVVKAIIETALLSDEEKKDACQMAEQAGASFVKTSTGFAKTGATVQDVALMRAVIGPHMGVKASGGIRNRQLAEALIDAGARRLGVSASLDLLLSH